MRLWEHTFEALTGGKQPLGDQDGPPVEFPWHPPTIVPITQNPRFATALLKGRSLAEQALLELVDGQWMYVGAFEGDTMILAPSARKQGVAEELLLRCAEHRNDIPFSSNFTRRGYRMFKRAHRLSVKNALAADLPVPQAVRDEYERG